MFYRLIFKPTVYDGPYLFPLALYDPLPKLYASGSIPLPLNPIQNKLPTVAVMLMFLVFIFWQILEGRVYERVKSRNLIYDASSILVSAYLYTFSLRSLSFVTVYFGISVNSSSPGLRQRLSKSESKCAPGRP